ncbi:MAG: AraC family ligand binding domain-containing protein [Lachnospiraceae bacterium]
MHWHNELEISLPRLGKARYQVYQKNYEVHPGEGLLLNRNVPHSCDSTDDSRTLYTTILVRPDFLYGDLGSDVERNCFRPFLQNSALPCILLTGKEEWSREALKKLNQVDTLLKRNPSVMN